MNLKLNEEKIKMLLVIISVAFAVFMANLDAMIVNISLPTIEQVFNVGSNKVSWVILIYLLVNTSLLLLFGKTGDRIGLKKVFMFGYLVFITGSLFCGLSSSINMLIASRAFQGIGSAMLASVSMAIIAKFLPERHTGTAFGMLTVAAALGITFGAPLGGFITQFWGWNWVFLINVPVGIIAFIVAAKVIPNENIDLSLKKATFDFGGAVLSFVMLTALIYGINMLQELGWKSPVIMTSFAVFVIALIVFIIWENSCADPLLNFSVFKNRNFVFSTIAAFTAFMFISGTAFLFPFYLEFAQGLKTYQAGLLLTVFSSIIMFTGLFFGRKSDKIGPRVLCVWGMFLSGLGTFLFAFFLKMPGLFAITALLIWTAFSNAMFIAPNNKLAMSSVSGQMYGVSAGALRTMMNIGLVIGICLTATIFSYAFPAGTVLAKTATGGINVSKDALFTGFRNAFIFCAIACFMASLFSTLTSKK